LGLGVISSNAMDRATVIAKLRLSRPHLAALGAGRLFLYGSVARDEADASSDVDLLVEPANTQFTFYDLIRLQQACSDALGAPAEIHDYGGYLRLPEFRARVEPDLMRVF